MASNNVSLLENGISCLYLTWIHLYTQTINKERYVNNKNIKKENESVINS